MTTRDIGTGWNVVEVVDARPSRLELWGDDVLKPSEEAEIEPVRCDCCDRKIQIHVVIVRGDEGLVVGQACAKRAGIGLPAKRSPRKAAPVVEAAPVAPAAPPPAPAPAPELRVDPSAGLLPDGTVDLIALLEAIEAIEAAEREQGIVATA
jgi:hypothetical protein